MLRWILQELGLFTLPFLAFAVWLLVSRRSPFVRAHWDPHWLRLILAGLVLAVGSLIALGLSTTRHADGYVPPHMEDGRLVPGRFQ